MYFCNKLLGDKDDYTDVTIIVEDASFQCHRALLISRSEYFRGVLSGHFKETTEATPTIVIKDIPKEIFIKVLEFVYTNTVLDIQDCELVRLRDSIEDVRQLQS
jgi:hypothetical protein